MRLKLTSADNLQTFELKTNELANDESNWSGPNLPALSGMLKAVGFKRVQVNTGTPVRGSA